MGRLEGCLVRTCFAPRSIGVRGRCHLAQPRAEAKGMGGVQGLTCADTQRSPWTSNHGGGVDVPHSPATWSSPPPPWHMPYRLLARGPRCDRSPPAHPARHCSGKLHLGELSAAQIGHFQRSETTFSDISSSHHSTSVRRRRAASERLRLSEQQPGALRRRPRRPCGSHCITPRTDPRSPVSVDYEEEDTAARRQRRRERWTPASIVLAGPEPDRTPTDEGR